MTRWPSCQNREKLHKIRRTAVRETGFQLRTPPWNPSDITAAVLYLTPLYRVPLMPSLGQLYVCYWQLFPALVHAYAKERWMCQLIMNNLSHSMEYHRKRNWSNGATETEPNFNFAFKTKPNFNFGSKTKPKFNICSNIKGKLWVW